MRFTKCLKFVKFRIYGNLWEKKESSGLILIFDPQCHTLVAFFSNLPYFEELDRILTKYNLKDKPHAIYNIDEKGINTEYKPPNVVAGRGYQPQTVNSERSKTVTLIGAGNALECQIPSYFVFPGQRFVPELLNGKS